MWRGRRNVGLGFTGFGVGVWDNKANTVFKDTGVGRDKGKGCPWARDRVRDHHHQGNKRPVDFGDLEWVGGWNDLHL